MPKQQYVYTLPADANKARANGLAMGALAALRNYPRMVTDAEQIEIAARSSCITLKDFYTSRERQLTNDFPGFCELFVEQYIKCYRENVQACEQSHEFYLKNKTAVDEIGLDVAYHLLVEDYTAQLEGKS